MKFVSLCKLFWKHNYKQLIIGTILIAAYYYYFTDHAVSLFFIALYPLYLVGTIYKFGERLERLQKLKARGLTEEDITNIEFVKKWEQARHGGLWRYCIRDGGLIAGAGLSLVLSLIFGITFPHMFKQILAEPGDMFRLIGIAYLGGAFVGLILFRIMWSYKEKKFARLTDPLNTIFASKISIDDLI